MQHFWGKGAPSPFSSQTDASLCLQCSGWCSHTVQFLSAQSPWMARWHGSCSRCVHRQRDRFRGVLLSELPVQCQSKSQGGLKQLRRTHGNCSWCLQLTAAPPGYSKSPPTPPLPQQVHGGLNSPTPWGTRSPKALGSAFLLAATLSQCHLAFVSGDGVMKASWKLGLFEVIQRDGVKSPLHSHDNIVVAELEQGWSLGRLAGGGAGAEELLLNSWINCYHFSLFKQALKSAPQK